MTDTEEVVLSGFGETKVGVRGTVRREGSGSETGTLIFESTPCSPPFLSNKSDPSVGGIHEGRRKHIPLFTLNILDFHPHMDAPIKRRVFTKICTDTHGNGFPVTGVLAKPV